MPAYTRLVLAASRTHQAVRRAAGRPAGRIVAALIIAAGLLFTASRAVVAAQSLLALRTTLRGGIVGAAGPRHLVGKPVGDLLVRTVQGQLDTLRLGAGPALILLYDHKCLYCSLTASRWFEVIAQASPSVPIYAIAIGELAEQRAYFAGLTARVTIGVLARDSAMLEVLGTQSIPSTIVVSDGRLAAVFNGILSRSRQAYVLSLLNHTRVAQVSEADDARD